MYLLDQNTIEKNEQFFVIKHCFGLLLNKSNIFEWQVLLLFFVFSDNKVSSHTDQISEHIDSSKHNIPFYYQISKMVLT